MTARKDDERGGDPPYKKAKKEKDSEKERVIKNETQIEGFKMKSGEKWDHFCGACADSKPDWGTNRLCHR